MFALIQLIIIVIFKLKKKYYNPYGMDCGGVEAGEGAGEALEKKRQYGVLTFVLTFKFQYFRQYVNVLILYTDQSTEIQYIKLFSTLVSTLFLVCSVHFSVQLSVHL